MNVVFVNWTQPFKHRDNFLGHKKDISNHKNSAKYNLPYYEILIQKLAFQNAKKFLKLPVKMYTDNQGYEFYQENNMLKYFDSVDTEVLENLNNSGIDPSRFWTSGKVTAICNEEQPSIFLDLDFILYSEIPQYLLSYDFVCTHWEITRRDYHLSKNQLELLSLSKYSEDNDMLMPNTSLLIINNSYIKKKYKELHDKIIFGEYKNYPDWLWLIPDQHILGFLLRELDINCETIDDRVFIQYPDSIEKVGKPGFTPRWCYLSKEVNNFNIKYNHVWFDKIGLKVNEQFRADQIKIWENELEL